MGWFIIDGSGQNAATMYKNSRGCVDSSAPEAKPTQPRAQHTRRDTGDEEYGEE